MGISDLIEQFIKELLSDENGIAELSRVETAQKFGCVPSQINYVISTRFSPEHGFIVESRRGGGGYIRITRVRPQRENLIMHAVNAVGDTIDERTALAFLSNMEGSGAISEEAARIIAAAISTNALRPADNEGRNRLRASILKHCLIKTNSFI